MCGINYLMESKGNLKEKGEIGKCDVLGCILFLCKFSIFPQYALEQILNLHWGKESHYNFLKHLLSVFGAPVLVSSKQIHILDCWSRYIKYIFHFYLIVLQPPVVPQG